MRSRNRAMRRRPRIRLPCVCLRVSRAAMTVIRIRLEHSPFEEVTNRPAANRNAINNGPTSAGPGVISQHYVRRAVASQRRVTRVRFLPLGHDHAASNLSSCFCTSGPHDGIGSCVSVTCPTKCLSTKLAASSPCTAATAFVTAAFVFPGFPMVALLTSVFRICSRS